MKNLFYKELKLAMHPVLWFFLFLCPLLILIPNYPLFIGFIYIISTMPILFLGANKGKQSNDIYFTVLLPIKKRDVVKARLLTVLFIQLVFVTLTLALTPLAKIVIANVVESGTETLEDVGLGLDGILSVTSFGIVIFAVYDLIFFSNFYKDGRRILGPMLFGTIVFCFLMSVLTIILPISFPQYKALFEGPLWQQLIYFGCSIIISLLVHIWTYKVASNRLEKVDL